MKWPTPQQINLQIAKILGYTICECEPGPVDWDKNDPEVMICEVCKGAVAHEFDWTTDRNHAAKLPEPINEWHIFGKVLIGIYSKFIGWDETANGRFPYQTIIAEILFKEPWIMPYAWVVTNGWEWDGEQWCEVKG